QEVANWQESASPINRFRKYLEKQNLWDAEKEKTKSSEIRKQVLKAFGKAEKRKKPSLKGLFTDVYDTLPQHLVEQEAELNRLLKKYPTHFNSIDQHAK
ncbi:hypothetical protein HDV02_000197, partial [Globomyces sp. JEL0801]